MPMKFTDGALRRLTPPRDARVDKWDSSLPGFGVRASGPSSRRTEPLIKFQLMYRHAGIQRRHTFEPPYPALSLKQARKLAGDMLAKLSAGEDPTAETMAAKTRAKREATNTLGALIDKFDNEHLQENCSPQHARNTKSLLLNHVVPRFGVNTKISDIHRGELRAIGQDVRQHGTTTKVSGRTHHLKGGPIVANRVVQSVKQLFRFAVECDLLPADPSALIRLPARETPREHTVMEDEIAMMWQALTDLGYPYGNAQGMMLLTAARRGEVVQMRWRDLSLDKGLWELSASATKSRRAHVVPLSPLAMGILRSVPRLSEEYVFVGRDGKPISGWSSARMQLERIIAANGGAVARFSRHDLRRTAASTLGKLGITEFLIGRILNHGKKGVTARHYNQFEYLPERRAALDKWASYIQSLVSSPADKVVALQQRA